MIYGALDKIVAGLLVLSTSACSTQYKSRIEPPKAVSSVDLTNYCKQLIGDVMGRDPNTMLAGRVTAEISSISYVRTDDQKEFKYQCKEEAGNIVWRGVDIFRPGEGPGRWRDEDARSIATFQ